MKKCPKCGSKMVKGKMGNNGEYPIMKCKVCRFYIFLKPEGKISDKFE